MAAHSRIFASLALASVALVTGCRAGGEDLEVVNNKLREENLTLRDQVAALEMQNAELNQAVKASSTESTGMAPDVVANLPLVTSISLDGLTTMVDTSTGTVLRAYVEPADGRGRFVQMTGDVTLKLVRVPAEEGEDAETVSEKSFSPAAVRDAYRSGFMGTHYTFEWPIESSEVEVEGDTWLVVATYVDGVTGATLKAERAIERERR